MTPRPYTRTEQVQTTMTLAERQRLDAYAADWQTSRATAIRQLVLEGLNAADAARRDATTRRSTVI